jgi:hypothetical protein
MNTAADDYPIRASAEVPATNSRLLALIGIIFLKLLLLLPHLIVLYFLQIAAFVVAWVGYWVILFTGRLPDGIHGFITGVQRWNFRINGWLFSLTDRYPPFTLGGDSLGQLSPPQG